MRVYQSYIAGALHGDAWCTALTIGLRVADEDFSKAFADALWRAHGIAKVPTRDERGYWLIRVSNKIGLFDACKRFEPVTLEEKAHWVRGMFDSEGNAQITNVVGKRAYLHRRVSLYSSDLTTLARTAGFLIDLGITTRQRETKNSAGHLGDKAIYELALRARRDFERFAELVGSSIGRKADTLARIATSYEADGWERAAQIKGAAARRKKTVEAVAPAVYEQIRHVVSDGEKPTHRRCLAIPGYAGLLNFMKHSEVLAAVGARA